MADDRRWDLGPLPRAITCTHCDGNGRFRVTGGMVRIGGESRVVRRGRRRVTITCVELWIAIAELFGGLAEVRCARCGGDGRLLDYS